MTNDRSLLKELLSVGVFKLGNFVLQSGQNSPIYVDLRLLFTSPKVLVSFFISISISNFFFFVLYCYGFGTHSENSLHHSLFYCKNFAISYLSMGVIEEEISTPIMFTLFGWRVSYNFDLMIGLKNLRFQVCLMNVCE